MPATAAAASPRPARSASSCRTRKSSARWATADLTYLKAAFAAAGVEVDIQNAQGDKANFQTIADGMISSGVKVLMIVNLDSGTGKAVLDKARTAGIATIDYDRLTLNGGANYYVSFDNVKVGELQGQGLVKCLADMKASKPVVAELNGSPTDNNATLFAKGYDSVLDPKYADGSFLKGPNQAVPDWDNAQAGTIFEQMLTSEKKIKGVLAANDGLGNAAISVLKKNKLNGQVPVTGQDATVQGLQNILTGDQCMTVYKAIKKEADAASELAIALAKEQQPTTATGVTKDPESGKDVPSVLLDPQSITKENVNNVDQGRLRDQGRALHGDFAKACTDAGSADQAVSTRLFNAPPMPCRAWAAPHRLKEKHVAATPLLELRGIDKSFGPVQVLHDVGLQRLSRGGDRAGRRQRRRQVHADQVHRRHPHPGRGRVHLGGQAGAIRSPRDAAALGIETVYQDLALCDNLDIVQNMFLGRERPAARARRATMERGRRDAGQPLGPHGDVGAAAGRVAVRRPAADRRDREGRAVELGS